MATFTSRDKEIVAASERLLRDKSNLLGADGYIISEPYGKNRHQFLDRIMRNSPQVFTAGDGYSITTPNFDDYPTEGQIGVRRQNIRLHSYLPSGKTGPSSVQTFLIVSAASASNDVSDIQNVRLNPIINPEFSVGRATAAEIDPTVRGFELALYPAKSTGGPGASLAADTDKGPISPFADPSAGLPQQLEAGAGDEGFWTVDYDAGIVRFSKPPLNGSNGVMNPNNVFGDINGKEVASGGAITMFATFYAYSGTFGLPDNMSFVTVGDGVISDGLFMGNNHNTVQAAIDSLPNGGTVFIKEGDYIFTDSVTLNDKISVVGLDRARIARPQTVPAFIISDGYCTIEGLEIVHGLIDPNAGGAIELRNDSVGETINDAKILNNVIYGHADGYAIAFGASTDCTYQNCVIDGNTFVSLTSNPGFIGGVNNGGRVTFNGVYITNNIAPQATSNNFIALNENSFATWGDLHIQNNQANAGIISISDITTVNDMNINMTGNSINSMTLLTVSGHINLTMTGNTISSSIVGSVISGDFVESSVISGNVFQAPLYITFDTNFASVVISGNEIQGDLVITGNDSSLFNIIVNGNDIEGNFSVLDIFSTDAMVVSNNIMNIFYMENTKNTVSVFDESIFVDNVITASGGITFNASGTGGATIQDSIISGNKSELGPLTINDAATTVSTITVTDSIISDNRFTSITISGAIFDSSINDNNASSTVTFDDFDQNNILSGNKFDGTFTLNVVDNSAILSNYFNSVTINSSISDMQFIGNQCFGTLTATSSILTSMIIGNTFNTSVSVAALAQAMFCNNKVGSGTGDFTVTGTTGSVVIADNFFRDDFFLNDTATNVSIVGNNCFGDFNFTGTLSGCTISDNVMSILTISESSNTTITGNKIASTATIDSLVGGTLLTNCVISDNRFASSLTIDASNGAITMQETIVSNNDITGNVLMGTSTSGGAGVMVRSTFQGNMLSGNLTFGNAADANSNLYTNSSIADNISQDAYGTFYGRFVNSNITDNVFNEISTGKLVESTFKGNLLLSIDAASQSTIGYEGADGSMIDSTFDNNFFNHDLFISGAVSGSTINGNHHTDNITFNSSLDTTIIDNNNVGSNIIFSALVDNSVFSNNNIIGNLSATSTSLGNFSDSIISGNRISGTLTVTTSSVATFLDVVFSNNMITGTTTIDFTGAAGTLFSNTVISGNVFFGNATWGADITTTESAVATDDSIISNNMFNGTLTIANASRSDSQVTHRRSTFVGNSHNSNLTLNGRIEYTTLSSNIFNVLDTGDVQWSSISGNANRNNTTFADLNDSNVVGNYWDGSFTVTSGVLSAVEFVSNQVTGALSPTTLKPSGTFTSTIHLNPIAQPSTSISTIGDLTINSTSGTLDGYGAAWYNYVPVSFISTTRRYRDNTAGVGVIQGTEYIIPANTLRVGSMIRVNVAGRMATVGSVTNLNLTLKLNGENLVAISTGSYTDNDESFYLLSTTTVRSATEIATVGMGGYPAAAASFGIPGLQVEHNDSTVFDSTQSNPLTFNIGALTGAPTEVIVYVDIMTVEIT